MPTNSEIHQYIETLAPLRKAQANALWKHIWFKNTPLEVQKEVLSLPSDHEGFIQDLITRPDEIGEVDVLRLTAINHGNYLITPVFEVRSNVTNQIHSFEYTSWKTGSRPGTKGIIFLETEGEITHFLVAKAHKFSTGTEEYEAIGGLYFHFLENKPQNLPRKIEHEICFHLGVDHLEFKKVVDLGTAHPDLGMTNNSSDLYAAVIDISQSPNLTTKADFRTTHKPIGFELKIIHINELKKYMNLINDNYFLSTISRVLVSDQFSLNL